MQTTVTFDRIVQPLTDDPAWRRRVRRVLLGALVRRAGAVALVGLGHAGRCFCAVPAPSPRRTGVPGSPILRP